ncbi:MAG: LacI family DNA-binding transcriptional regulator, partial [Bacteroidota bacterium]
MATIVEVARLAGVSKSTVSRVLNGVPVSDEAKRRVEAAIKKLNFKPNAQARGLSLRRNHLVGVVVPEIARLFYGEILEGISAALA